MLARNAGRGFQHPEEVYSAEKTDHRSLRTSVTHYLLSMFFVTPEWWHRAGAWNGGFSLEWGMGFGERLSEQHARCARRFYDRRNSALLHCSPAGAL